MNRDIASLEKSYLAEIGDFDKKIDEIKRHMNGEKVKGKVLNLVPIHHLLEAANELRRASQIC